MAIREQYDIALSKQLDIPRTSQKSVLALVHRLPACEERGACIQATLLNFSGKKTNVTVTSEHFPADATIIDTLTGEEHGRVNKDQTITLEMAPYQGMSLLLK